MNTGSSCCRITNPEEALGGSSDHRHQHGFVCQHKLQTSMRLQAVAQILDMAWPLMVRWTTAESDCSRTSDPDMPTPPWQHRPEHHHGPRGQRRPFTSLWPPAAARPIVLTWPQSAVLSMNVHMELRLHHSLGQQKPTWPLVASWTKVVLRGSTMQEGNHSSSQASIIAQSGRSCCTPPCSILLSNVSCCRPQPSLMPVTVNSSPFPPRHSTETASFFSFPPLHHIFVHYSRPHLEAWLTSATSS